MKLIYAFIVSTVFSLTAAAEQPTQNEIIDFLESQNILRKLYFAKNPVIGPFVNVNNNCQQWFNGGYAVTNMGDLTPNVTTFNDRAGVSFTIYPNKKETVRRMLQIPKIGSNPSVTDLPAVNKEVVTITTGVSNKSEVELQRLANALSMLILSCGGKENPFD
ncbi:MAG: hypothetical protein ACMZ64_06695 [Oleiphilus sp.]